MAVPFIILPVSQSRHEQAMEGQVLCVYTIEFKSIQFNSIWQRGSLDIPSTQQSRQLLLGRQPVLRLGLPMTHQIHTDRL